MMPTGSFKDRGFSLAVSYASELHVKRGLTYSSGNAGASFSAYSARAGFPGVVLVEYLRHRYQKAMILLYGAKAAIEDYENFDQISAMLDGAVQELGCYMFVNFINPVRHEAMKTCADLWRTRQSPGLVAFLPPRGNGRRPRGTWKGYNELLSMGVTDKLPHMVGVQPEAVCWLKQAVDTGTAACTDAAKTRLPRVFPATARCMGESGSSNASGNLMVWRWR